METWLLEPTDSQRYASLLSKPLEEARIVEKLLLELHWLPAPEGVSGSALSNYVVAIPLEADGLIVKHVC